MSDAFSKSALAELDRVYSAARRLCSEPQEAEDLVQEVYAEAFAKKGLLREVTAMRAWLFRILHGKFVDHIRRRQRTPSLVAVDASEDYDHLTFDRNQWLTKGTLIQTLQTVEIGEALRKLPLDQRTVLVLREIGELNYEEISEACQIPVGTVRSRLSRARRNMQSSLVELAKDYGILGKEGMIDGPS